MTRVEILHKREPDFEPTPHGEVELVAVVEVNRTGVVGVLEEAYGLTQNIDTAWIRNSEVIRYFGNPDGCRSSSVGDIFYVDGTPYLVDRFGWEQLEQRYVEIWHSRGSGL
jgi:hypothetical protein